MFGTLSQGKETILVPKKQPKVIKKDSLYKWNKNWKRIQTRYWGNQYKLRRIQQIEDFVKLNGFQKVYHIQEVLLDAEIPTVDNINDCDLILVTHQGYSRLPMTGIVEQINSWLEICPNLYLCLNRYYLNIDNQKIDMQFTGDYLTDITKYFKENLNYNIVDLSSDYNDDGSYFTWVVPDRQYFISK